MYGKLSFCDVKKQRLVSLINNNKRIEFDIRMLPCSKDQGCTRHDLYKSCDVEKRNLVNWSIT